MKFKKIKESVESGGSILNSERQISGLTNKPEYSNETNPMGVGGKPVTKPSTDLFPFELSSLKNQLNDIAEKTFSLRGQCVAALENPSVKKKKSKGVVIRKVLKELDNINKKIIEDIPNILNSF